MRKENLLSEKQEAFCREYVSNNGNAVDATRCAGYVDRGDNTIRIIAALNLTNPHIIQRIKNIRERVDIKGKVSIEWMIEHLKEIVSRCMEEKPVVVGGVETNEYRFNPQGALKALTEITKIMGWKNEKLTVEFATDEEKLADIRRRMRERVGRDLDENLGEESSKFSAEEKAALIENIINSRYEAEDKVFEEIALNAILEKNRTLNQTSS